MEKFKGVEYKANVYSMPLNCALKQITAAYQVVIYLFAFCLHVDMELGVQVKLQQWPITPIALLVLPTMLTLEVEFSILFTTLTRISVGLLKVL